jgi:death on curing protein
MRIPLWSSCDKPTETAANDSPYIYPTFSQIRELHHGVVWEHPGAECLGNLGNIVTCTTSEEATRREANGIFDTASSYARFIAQKRLFKDGNKRIGLAASLVFLEINGVADHDYYEPVLQEAILYLAEGDVSEEHFAQFLRHLFSEANSNLE